MALMLCCFICKRSFLRNSVRHGSTRVRVMLVPINTTKLDGLPVDTKDAAVGAPRVYLLLQLNSSEPNLLVYCTAVEGYGQAIQVWILSGPLAGILHRKPKHESTLSRLGFCRNFCALGVQKPQLHLGRAANLDLCLQSRIPVVVVNQCLDPEVLDVLLRELVEPDIAKDPAELTIDPEPW